MIEVFKLNDVEADFRSKPFGQQIASLIAIDRFRESPETKVVWLSQKGGKIGGATGKKVIREFLKQKKCKQYHSSFNANEFYLDDTFQLFYQE